MNPQNPVSSSWLAPCKINPTLVVIERRSDGFHELDLTYLALDLCDHVRLSAARGRAAALRVDGPMASQDIPTDARNLAQRAARAVTLIARADGLLAQSDDFDLELTKAVPSQAGLGGGSSDAAASALGVCTLCGLSPGDPRVLRALAQLGSDCVFFFAARASGHARGRGRGELIEVLPALRQPLWIALIAPRERAPTEVVYRALGDLGDAATQRAHAALVTRAWSRATTLESARAALFNALESAALRALPELADWRSLLDSNAGEHFRLAGSGSSFFGLYSSGEAARTFLEQITRVAAERGLELRGTWVARPAEHGVRMTL